MIGAIVFVLLLLVAIAAALFVGFIAGASLVRPGDANPAPENTTTTVDAAPAGPPLLAVVEVRAFGCVTRSAVVADLPLLESMAMGLGYELQPMVSRRQH